MKFEYPYTVEKQEDGRYLVQFVDFTEAYTEGETLEEAAFNAAEVLSLVIEQRIDDKKDIPSPSAGRHRYRAAPAASVQAALLIRYGREERGQTVAEVARALETSWPAAQRLEDPRHSPTLKQLERAAAAVGKRLVLVFE